VVVVVGLIAAKSRAIEHGAAEFAHVLIMVMIATACVAAAAVAVVVAARYHRAAARAASRAAMAARRLTVPASLANPYNGHRVTCECQPCAIYWDTAAGRIVYLMAAGQPIPEGLQRAADRQARLAPCRTVVRAVALDAPARDSATDPPRDATPARQVRRQGGGVR